MRVFQNEYVLTVDIKKHFADKIPTFVQYDEARLKFYILDNSTPFDLSEFTSGKVYHKKPDGTVEDGDVELETDEDGNSYIEYKYIGSEMSSVGDVETSLSVFAGEKKVSIRPFIVRIVKDMSGYYTEPSNPEYNELQRLIAEVEELVGRAETAVDNANEATQEAKEIKEHTEQLAQEVSTLKDETEVVKNEAITATESANTASDKANSAANSATEAASKAEEATADASESAEYAMEQGNLAKNESSNLSQMKEDVVQATNDAIEASEEAESVKNETEQVRTDTLKVKNDAEELIGEMTSATVEAIQATEDASEAATSANESAELASVASQDANESAIYAMEQGNLAKDEATNLSQLKEEVVQATTDANEIKNSTEAVRDATEQVREDTLTVKNDAKELVEEMNTATENAVQATETAVEATEDVLKIKDDLVEVHDEALEMVETWQYLGGYDTAVEYKKNNIVTFNGSSYIAIQDNTDAPPTGDTSDSNWKMVARKGEDGEGLVVLHKEVFTAQENQREFQLENEYDQFQNRVRVIVDGVEQFSPDNFVESTSQSITLSEQVRENAEITVVYFGEAPAIKNDLQLQIDGIIESLNYIDGDGTVKSVNGQFPDASGNIQIEVGDVEVSWDSLQGKPEVLDELSEVDGKLNYKGESVGSVTSVNGQDGEVELNASDIGAETPEGAQNKANTALDDAKEYADTISTEAQEYTDTALSEANEYTDNRIGEMGTTVKREESFTAEDGQTEFTFENEYEYIDVYVNSVIQRADANYTKPTNSSIIFNSELDEGDLVFVQLYSALRLSEDVVNPVNYQNLFMSKSGGELEGVVKAHNNTDYETAQLRNVILSPLDADINQMNDGDIWIKFE